MKSLATFKPPPENEATVQIFEAVHKSLNDIDRSLYPPVATLHQRRGELIAAYEAVGKHFEQEANATGIADWLRFTIVNRKFGLKFADDAIEGVRRLYEEMEQLGYPDANPLTSVRMIWANRLAKEGLIDEAQAVVRQLVADVEEFSRLFPNVLVPDFHADLARFRKRHGV